VNNLLDNILYDVIKVYRTIQLSNPTLQYEQIIERFTDTLDNIPYPVVISDVEKFKPAYLNLACRSFINISVQQAKSFDNRFYYQYVHNDSVQMAPLGISHFMNQPQVPYHICYKINISPNTHRWVYLVTHTLEYSKDVPSNIKYMISIFIDIQTNINNEIKKVLPPEEKNIDMVLLLKSLTPRERKVLSLMAKEYSIEYIAEMMNITPNTVKTYRQKIMTKLGVKTGLGLGRFCLLNEYIDA
jgi:hypothetical protein